MARQDAPDTHRGAVFNRRLLLLGGVQIAAFGLIGARLYNLQVNQWAELAEQGQDDITRTEFSLAERGGLNDRAGLPLAFNSVQRSVLLRFRDFQALNIRPTRTPAQSLRLYGDLFALGDAALARVWLDVQFALGEVMPVAYLAQLSQLPEGERALANFAQIAEGLLDGPNTDLSQELNDRSTVVIESGISLLRSSQVGSREVEMPFIEQQNVYERLYLRSAADQPAVQLDDETDVLGIGNQDTQDTQDTSDLAIRAISPVLGYTRRVFREDLAGDDDPMLRLPGARKGARGVEASYDRTLRGTAGSETWRITGGGRPIELLEERAPQRGDDLNLTLDLRLQTIAAALLSVHQEASAVLLDVETSEILVMASQPTFNVNDFVPGISQLKWDAYRNNEFRPLVARASQGVYPPGSTFKMIVTLAALEYGLTPATTWNCPGFLEVSGQRFRCWKRRGHGDMDMYGALRESCDVWFYQAAQILGLERMRQVAARFGFGTSVIETFGDQSSALLPTRAWKQRTKGADWFIGDSVQFAIGQGFMSATPMQLATMTAVLANGGRQVRPHLVKSDGFYAPQNDLGFDPNHLAIVREAMNQVVNSDTGTAKTSRLELPGNGEGEIWRMAGKTGTAQVTAEPPDESATVDFEKPYGQRDHALFVGYAPLSSPKFACCVVVDHGGSGSAAAAPIARDLLTAALFRWKAGRLQ